MRKEQCEAYMVTSRFYFEGDGNAREGDRCDLDGEPVAIDGELRCLCWTHKRTALDGTRELALAPLVPYEFASDVAAARAVAAR